jgi:hypothetical protein
MGVEVAGAAGALAPPAGAAALPVWANAEIVNPTIIERTAMARTDRKNLLVIGSLKLLGTLVPVNMVPVKMFPGMNSDYLFRQRCAALTGTNLLGQTREVFVSSFFVLLQPAASDTIRQGALNCQRHTPGLRTCRPPLVNFLQWRGSTSL